MTVSLESKMAASRNSKRQYKKGKTSFYFHLRAIEYKRFDYRPKTNYNKWNLGSGIHMFRYARSRLPFKSPNGHWVLCSNGLS